MKYLTTILLFFSFIANSNDIVVNGSGLPGTYNTISAAVNAANPGDKILVSNQSFPYQEDTLFINKSVTIVPYSDIAYIDYEGPIKITLDSIENLTLIGFNSDNYNVITEFNDTSRNSLSTINIIDCIFEDLRFDQPKTTLNLSYSTVNWLNFSHGNIIGNSISGLTLGAFKYKNALPNNGDLNFYWFANETINYINYGSGSNWVPRASSVFDNLISFGNVNTYSDTVNIIANNINNNIAILTIDFPFHIFNNSFNQINIIRHASSLKGRNRVINNNISKNLRWFGVLDNNKHNLSYINIDYLNNSQGTGGDYNYQFYFDFRYFGTANENSIGTILEPGLVAYNTTQGSSSSYYFRGYVSSNFNNYNQYNSSSNYDQGNFTPFLLMGPGGGTSSSLKKNPSPEFLNLDLTINNRGIDGGSHAWDNYHPTGSCGFGTIGNNKARITYLNLPTQIFDPSNITIKAKAVHGN